MKCNIPGIIIICISYKMLKSKYYAKVSEISLSTSSSSHVLDWTIFLTNRSDTFGSNHNNSSDKFLLALYYNMEDSICKNVETFAMLYGLSTWLRYLCRHCNSYTPPCIKLAALFSTVTNAMALFQLNKGYVLLY